MKKMITTALSLFVLASLTGYVYAETAPVAQAEKPAVAPQKDKHGKQHTATKSDKSTEKSTTDAPEIGSKTEETQGRGLPKAFSNSEGQ
jgi:hypothetical protein